jgi:hypothetical protein
VPLTALQMRKRLARSTFQLSAKRGIKNVNLDELAAHVDITQATL